MSKNSLPAEALTHKLWFIIIHHKMDRDDGTIQVNKQIIDNRTSVDPSIFINIIYAALHPGMKPILISVAGTDQEEAIMKFEGAVVDLKQKLHEIRQ